jgi:hypothetical protein
VPVAKSNPRQSLAIAAAAVVLVVGFVALVFVISSARGGGGGEEFDTLQVGTLLARQDRDGVPSCFGDPVDGTRPICVFHLPGPDDEGWVAYDAQVDGCPFESLEGATELVDSCTGERYPFDGTGLPQYPARVEEGHLIVDLLGTGSTTTATSEG